MKSKEEIYFEGTRNEDLMNDALSSLLKICPDGENQNAEEVQEIIIELTRRANNPDKYIANIFLHWVAERFDIVADGDFYWKGDTDGDKPLSAIDVVKIYEDETKTG